MLKSLNKRSAIIIIIVVSAVIYLGTLLNGFVLDDKYQVLNNPWIIDFSHIPELLTSTVWAFKESFAATDYYRPTMFLPYIVEHALFGFAPWGWHLVNIILHSINAILVFLIACVLMNMKRAGSSEEGPKELDGSIVNTVLFPLASALLFAVHPVNSEVVNWVAGGTELTYTLFFLLSFYLYTRIDRFSFRNPFYILSLISFFIATFSKEVAIVLPLFIIIYDYLRIDGPGFLSRLRFKAYPAYFAVAVFYLLMRFKAIGEVVVHSLYSDDMLVLTANILPITVEYLKLLFFPLKLSHYHYFAPALGIAAPKILLSLVIVAVTVVVLCKLVRRIAAAPFLISLVIIPMIPTLYLLFFHDRSNPLAFYSERYLYLPSVGFSILLCAILMRFVVSGDTRRKAKVVAVALVIVFIAGGARTVARSFEWKSDHTLWRATIERFPENYLARYHFSDVYRESGDTRSALYELTESIKIEPDFMGSHLKLGHIYYSMGKSSEALREYKEALRIEETSSVGHRSVGVIYMDLGRWNEAIEELQAALEFASVDMERVEIQNALAVSFARTGDMEKTRKILSEALKLDPLNKETLRNIEFLDSAH